MEQKRSCGECSACCQGWLEDKKLDMYPGKPCAHHCDTGCSIYPDRPETPCRTFRCAWLDNDVDYPEDFRPDLSGVILMEDRPWQEWLVLQAMPVGPFVPAESLTFLQALAEKRGRPLIWQEWVMNEEGRVTDSKQGTWGPPAFTERRKNQDGKRNLAGFTDEDVITFTR